MVPAARYGRAMSDSSAFGASSRMDLRNVQAKGQAHACEMMLSVKEWSQTSTTRPRRAVTRTSGGLDLGSMCSGDAVTAGRGGFEGY